MHNNPTVLGPPTGQFPQRPIVLSAPPEPKVHSAYKVLAIVLLGSLAFVVAVVGTLSLLMYIGSIPPAPKPVSVPAPTATLPPTPTSPPPGFEFTGTIYTNDGGFTSQTFHVYGKSVVNYTVGYADLSTVSLNATVSSTAGGYTDTIIAVLNTDTLSGSSTINYTGDCQLTVYGDTKFDITVVNAST